jgi:hypothetical protein
MTRSDYALGKGILAFLSALAGDKRTRISDARQWGLDRHKTSPSVTFGSGTLCRVTKGVRAPLESPIFRAAEFVRLGTPVCDTCFPYARGDVTPRLTAATCMAPNILPGIGIAILRRAWPYRTDAGEVSLGRSDLPWLGAAILALRR